MDKRTLYSKTKELRERTFHFGIRCVRLAEALPRTTFGYAISKQLIRSGTSVRASYRAARRARSTAEFIATLGVVEEECGKTLYQIGLIERLQLAESANLKELQKEAEEVLSIIAAAIKTARTERN